MHLRDLLNLGPASEAMLHAAGIKTPTQLRELGAVAAFIRTREADIRPSLNLLYAIHGALTETHWNQIPPADKNHLLLELDAYNDLHQKKIPE